MQPENLVAGLLQLNDIHVYLTKAGGSLPGCEFLGSPLMKAIPRRGCNWIREKKTEKIRPQWGMAVGVRK